MTTMTMSPRSTTTSPRLTFVGVVRSELLGLTSLRSMRWLAVTVVALGAFGALMFAGGDDATSTSAVLGAATFAGVGAALLAGLSVAGGYATGAAQTTFTVVPRRGLLIGAKSAVLAAVGFFLGLGAMGTGLATGAALHTGVDDWFAPDVAVRALGGAVYVAVLALFGMFVGCLVRGVAGTTTALIAVVFLLPPLLGGVRLGGAWVSDLLLAETGAGLVLGTGPWPGALLVTTLWVAVPAALATYRLARSDA